MEGSEEAKVQSTAENRRLIATNTIPFVPIGGGEEHNTKQPTSPSTVPIPSIPPPKVVLCIVVLYSIPTFPEVTLLFKNFILQRR
jgi:hypothetical protein